MKILIRNGNKEKWQFVQPAGKGAESELQRLLAEQLLCNNFVSWCIQSKLS